MQVQDTVAICATQISQHVALGALEAGRAWVQHRVAGLGPSRAALLDALSPLGALGQGVAGGEGAIYLWARLPCEDDEAVVEWLVRKHKVCVIPGSACGCPGHIRVAFANLEVDACLEALKKAAEGSDNVLYPLKEALKALATVGEVSNALREVWGVYSPQEFF